MKKLLAILYEKSFLKLFTLLIFIFSISTNTLAQSKDWMPNFTPTTPETASLLKFQETPVSYYTGQSNVSVPICVVTVDGVQVPINISYHAGGIRVNEIASEVGLGWNISKGGQITRVTKGKPDEESYLTTNNTAEQFINLHNGLTPTQIIAGAGPSVQTITNLFSQVRTGNLDYEPDEFNYSFMGYSGKFVFNQTRSSANPYGEIVMLPENDLKITPILDNNKIIRWEVITPNGITFIFGVDSWNTRFTNSAGEYLTSTQSVSKPFTGSVADNNKLVDVFSAWKLKKIITANQREINFEYVTDDYCSYAFAGETKIISPNSYLNNLQYQTKSYSSSIGKKSRLVKIYTDKEQILFNYGARLDHTQGYKLENVQVKDKHNTLVKKISFSYDYFQSSDTNKNGFIHSVHTSTHYPTDAELQKRLKLIAVNFEGKTTASASNPQKYQFEYNQTHAFPNRYSFAQDTWGYYNGANSNWGLLPMVSYGSGSPNTTMVYNGNNRKINTDYAKTGLLKKIIYPTKGYTEFEYESNKALLASSELIGLEPIFELPLSNESTFVENTLQMEERRALNPATQLYEYTYTKSFTIGSSITNNNVAYQVFSNIINSGVYNVNFKIFKKTNSPTYQEIYSNSLSSNGTLSLSAGEYRVKLIIEATYYNPNTQTAKVSLSWGNTIPQNVTIKTGGLRIKEIKHFDFNSNVAKLKRAFDYPLQHVNSFSLIPVFIQTIKFKNPANTNPGAPCPYTFDTGKKLSSYSVYPVLSTQGGNIGYQKVVEKAVLAGSNTVAYENTYEYTFNTSYNERREYNNILPTSYEWISGNLKKVKRGDKEEIFTSFSPLLNPNPTYFPEKKSYGVVMNIYPDYSLNPEYIPEQYACTGSLVLPKYTYNSGFNMVNSKVTKRFEQGNEIIVTENYSYNTNSLSPTKVETVYNNSDKVTTENFYSATQQNIPELSSAIKATLSARHLKKQIKTIIKRNGAILSTEFTNYKDWGNNIILPDTIKASKAGLVLEPRVAFRNYDNKGNLREAKKVDGTSVVYIWGYQKTQPIAKIENATYSQVQSYVSNLQTLSNADNDRTVDQINNNGTIHYKGKEGTLRSALNVLRTNLPNAQITTFTHDPLIGVTSITDPRGNVMYYVYDSFNRLQYVKDKDGHVLKEHKYHYKN